MHEAPVTQTIEDLYNARPDVDNSKTFPILWETMCALFDRMASRFELTQHPSSKRWEKYESPDGKYQGSLRTFGGPELDWLVYSWIGQPKTGFCNMHLNVWLGGQTDVPHVSFVLGTVPNLFAYSDYPPRRDLWSSCDYLDRYYEPENRPTLKWRTDPRLSFFVSESTYMRACLTPAAICGVGEGDPDPGLIRELSREYLRRLDTWIGWVDAARDKPLPEAQAAELVARDRYIRKQVAQRDPVNALAEKFFGKAMTADLVDALWGVGS